MAMMHKDECYTQLVHFESGKMLSRRMHELKVQRADGAMVLLTGRDLPDSIVSFAGNGHKDDHQAFVFSREGAPAFMPDFRPRRGSPQRWRHYADPDWPMRRDVIHMAIGVIAIGVLKLIATGSVFGGF